ncbi:hypothetical protein V1L54_11620 [Streptomyces sp. TRM 70361]|uniref:hypothetical protein n=1 Tax=Streptomyces sp. TRM 70361 TaxID=3116553 RepID=UPI002E7AB02A|nr:hypothetical protein [Streptomyces sp. TRM 70361]MEE1940036.1 hypothetical protein [Streptomyces sp. TRM 70361]
MRFRGWIAAAGTSSGTRVVLGYWPDSPFGPFGDVMLERAGGQRLLLAPDERIADFVAAVYRFDRVRIVPVAVDAAGPVWHVEAGPLDLRLTVGRRGGLGWLLRCVPAPLAARPAWAALTDLPARLLPGVRTRGSAGGGYWEWYGALDLLPITSVTASFEGRDLGTLAPVDPPVRFGFGSAPRSPALVRVITTVDTPRGRHGR